MKSSNFKEEEESQYSNETKSKVPKTDRGLADIENCSQLHQNLIPTSNQKEDEGLPSITSSDPTSTASTLLLFAPSFSFSQELSAILILLLVNFLFGSSFVVIKESYNDCSPVLSLAFYNTAGALPLILCYFRRIRWRRDFQIGLMIGMILTMAMCLQNVGISMSTTDKSAFVAASYITIAPIFAWIFFRAKIRSLDILGLFFAFTGLYLLTQSGKIFDLREIKYGFGDLLNLISAIFYALHLSCINRYTTDDNFYSISVYQLLISATIALGIAPYFDSYIYSYIVSNIENENDNNNSASQVEELGVRDFGTNFTSTWGIALVYNGILSTGLGFTLLTYGVQNTSTLKAALVCATEPIFTAISSYFYYHDILSHSAIVGALLIIMGIPLGEFSELQSSSCRRKKNKEDKDKIHKGKQPIKETIQIHNNSKSSTIYQPLPLEEK